MTYTEEFIADEEQGFGEEGSYPTAFGITFTPKVTGIALALLGLLTSAYLLMNFGLASLTEYNELKTQENDKRQQVEAKESGKLDQEKLNLEAELKRTQLMKQQVLGLYSRPDTLNTILLDVNRFLGLRNVKLTSFQPAGAMTVVADGSLGPAVNNKLKRQSYQLTVNGTYQNIQAFLRDLEQLQPLLIVRNFSIAPKAGLGEFPVEFDPRPNGVYAIPNDPTNLEGGFILDVILPAN